MDHKTKIKKLNKEIEKIQTEAREKIGALQKERDALVLESEESCLNRFLKLERDGNKFVCSVIKPLLDYTIGEVFAYYVKVLGLNEHFYHDYFYVLLDRYDKYEFISEEEFNELKEKGIKLIMEDVK